MGEILVNRPVEGVVRITLNRPDALNALTYVMYDELIEAFEACRYDKAVRVVVLTGAGRGFCAGHDIRAAGQPGWLAEGLGKAQTSRAIMDRIGRIPLMMRSLPQPVIAAVNGTAAGAGYSLALAADMCLAARTALELAQAVAVNSPIAMAITKSSLMMNQNAGSLEQAIELENRGIFMSQSTQDSAEKRKSFIEKRPPVFTGE